MLKRSIVIVVPLQQDMDLSKFFEELSVAEIETTHKADSELY